MVLGDELKHHKLVLNDFALFCFEEIVGEKYSGSLTDKCMIILINKVEYSLQKVFNLEHYVEFDEDVINVKEIARQLDSINLALGMDNPDYLLLIKTNFRKYYKL